MTRAVAFWFLAAASLIPGVPTWLALGAGIALGLSGPHPYPAQAKRAATVLLQVSVVGLGAGMNLSTVLQVGKATVGQTLFTISATMALAVALAAALRAERITSLLIGVGTAVCGGSAIAAVAPAIGAKPHQTSVALAVVFLLNAVALLVFPPLGHWLGLDPSSFGLWSALAIHDTSSVVGAAMQAGEQALQVATTVKLTRALWIVPLTLVMARLVKAEGGQSAAKKPWFIAGFVAAAALASWVPGLGELGQLVAAASRQVLVATLFLIGTGVNRQALASVGHQPLLLGVTLWLAVASVTAALIRFGWLSA